MLAANKNGESITFIFIKYSFIATTVSIPMAILSAVYSLFKFGTLQVEHLYVPLK